MKVLITGTSKGIGRETALLFLERGMTVVGFDILPPTILKENYYHICCDVRDKENFTFPTFPDMKEGFDIVINNAGVQNTDDDMGVNLIGAMNITEHYAFNNPNLKALLFNASASAHTGFEFGEYSASKAGMIGYMKHCAWRVAKIGATCNSISCGGVLTELNKPVMDDKDMWEEIMEVTPLKRWAEPKEIAEWIYFITVTNKFMSGQDILIDGGEKDLNCNFKYPGFNL